MNRENSQRLIESYPELLHKDFHFECGDGWFDIINEMLRRVKESSFPQKVIQIKEKYGYMFVYLYQSNQELQDIINDAREKSKSTCEICGNAGGPSSTEYGIVYARCMEHRIGNGN